MLIIYTHKWPNSLMFSVLKSDSLRLKSWERVYASFLTAICGLSDKSLYSFALVHNFVFPFQPKVWRTTAFFDLDLEWQADSGSVQLPVSFPQPLSGAPQAWDNPRYRGAYSAQNG